MRLSRILASALATLCLAAPSARAEPAPTLRIGIPRPYDEASAKASAEMLDGYFSSALKRNVETRVLDGSQLAAALAKGELDVAWITPMAYVDAVRQAPVVAIAKALRRNSMFYKSCVVVRADAKYATLADLKGARAAWVDKESTSGHVIPKAVMLKEGLSLAGFFASETFAGDHKGACSAVLSGAADVSGTYTDADGTGQKPLGCGDLGAEALAKLKCLAVSENITNEVIAGRPGLDEVLAGELGSLLAGLAETDSGRKLLETAFKAQGFGFAVEEDFEPIRKASQAVAAGKWPESKPAAAAAPAAPAKGAKGAKPAPPAKAPAKAPAKGK